MPIDVEKLLQDHVAAERARREAEALVKSKRVEAFRPIAEAARVLQTEIQKQKGNTISIHEDFIVLRINRGETITISYKPFSDRLFARTVVESFSEFDGADLSYSAETSFATVDDAITFLSKCCAGALA